MAVDISTLTDRANAGDLSVQLELAGLYETGTGVPIDRGRAAHWYRIAAEQGAAKAQSHLGQMYIRGIGVPKDHMEAVYVIRKAWVPTKMSRRP
ncbi:MAG: TPR repeat protein, SEL1 subfamily [Gammaproteobacteria bacterium]|nr:TPR repeat protein, SEL1 subfamily [Gammaproteobacteria bacterium]